MKIRKAVLIIHGFAGGTYDEEAIAYYLELKGFDVYSFTLPGHDRSYFNKITKEDWIKSSKKHIEMLINNGYTTIYLIGHSMGGILVSYLAANYKEVKKLVLAAPAFKYLTFDEEKFRPITVIKNSPKIFKDYDKEEIISRLLHFPSSVVKEFMNLVEMSQDLPEKINIPTLIIQGTNDDIVPLKSAEFVYDNLNTKKKYLMLVEGLNHDVFKGKNEKLINTTIEKFLKFGVYKNEKNK